jgi:hypothetical protein
MAPAEKITIAVTASTMFFTIGLCSFSEKDCHLHQLSHCKDSFLRTRSSLRKILAKTCSQPTRKSASSGALVPLWDEGVSLHAAFDSGGAWAQLRSSNRVAFNGKILAPPLTRTSVDGCLAENVTTRFFSSFCFFLSASSALFHGNRHDFANFFRSVSSVWISGKAFGFGNSF